MIDQDTYETMATVTRDCPPHLLKFADYGRNEDGEQCTIKRCQKCGYEEQTPMPDEREKRRE